MFDVVTYGTDQQTVQGDVITGNVYDIYDADDQDYDLGRMPFLGQRVKYRDGRCFVFCSSAVALTAGQVVAAPAGLTEYDGKLKAAVAGKEQVAITAAGITAEAWAGGTLVISDSATAPGMVYPIIGNTLTLVVAEGIGAIGDVIVNLGAPLVVAVAATDDCVVTPNRWNNTVVGTAALCPVGVTMVATAGNVEKAYFWSQTHGPGGVVVTTVSGVDAGDAVMAAAAGSVVVSDGTKGLIGTIRLSPTADGDVASIDLCIG